MEKSKYLQPKIEVIETEPFILTNPSYSVSAPKGADLPTNVSPQSKESGDYDDQE